MINITLEMLHMMDWVKSGSQEQFIGLVQLFIPDLKGGQDQAPILWGTNSSMHMIMKLRGVVANAKENQEKDQLLILPIICDRCMVRMA